ncbi:hypothetical protein HanPI659440_Chr12g0467791 [Helianthus annuus]|nr:hypothetical protein HanPI659440_Chr12g0467791 [Helianthus annuus]
MVAGEHTTQYFCFPISSSSLIRQAIRVFYLITTQPGPFVSPGFVWSKNEDGLTMSNG